MILNSTPVIIKNVVKVFSLIYSLGKTSGISPLPNDFIYYVKRQVFSLCLMFEQLCTENEIVRFRAQT